MNQQEIQDLQANLSKFRDQYDLWASELITSLENDRKESSSAAHTFKENVNDLKRQEVQYRKEEEELNHRLDIEKHEIDTLKISLAHFENKENALPQFQNQIDADLHNAHAQLASIQSQIMKIEMERENRHKHLTKSIECYKLCLGLTIDSATGYLKFTFTQIDPQDTKRPFSITMRVENNRYLLDKCEPKLSKIDELFHELNVSDSLHIFIINVRAQFQQSI